MTTRRPFILSLLALSVLAACTDNHTAAPAPANTASRSATRTVATTTTVAPAANAVTTSTVLDPYPVGAVDEFDRTVVARVDVGDVTVALATDPAGGYTACFAAAAGVVPDHAVCVGPFRGGIGEKNSRGRADRVGRDVIVIMIHPTADSILDDRLTAIRPTAYPLAVTAGVLRDEPSDVICLAYLTPGHLKMHYALHTSLPAMPDRTAVPAPVCPD